MAAAAVTSRMSAIPRTADAPDRQTGNLDFRINVGHMGECDQNLALPESALVSHTATVLTPQM